MNIKTMGSIVLDAIANCDKSIRNKERVTNISPFSIVNNAKSKVRLKKEELLGENEYIKEMLCFETSGGENRNSEECEWLVIDLLDARMSYEELLLDDGSIFRITRSNYTKDNIGTIEKSIEKQMKIVEKKLVNPLTFSDDVLDKEIRQYAEYLKENYDEEKIIMVEGHNAYQYITNQNKISIATNVQEIVQYNQFYDRCVNFMKKYLACKMIRSPKNMVADERKNKLSLFNVSDIYKQYLSKSVEAVVEDRYGEAYLQQYEEDEKKEIEMILMQAFAEQVWRKFSGRELVLIGNVALLKQILTEKYGLHVIKVIEYDANISIDVLKENLSVLKSYSQCICVIPQLYRGTKLLENLWGLGYLPGEGYICNEHEDIRLNDFIGTYEDVYQNRIKSGTPITISVVGSGNDISIGNDGSGSKKSKFRIKVGNENQITLANGVLNICGEGRLECLDGSVVQIGEGTTFGLGFELFAQNMGKVAIGKDCMFSMDVIVKNTENDAIMHSRKKNESSKCKKEIVLEDHVWLGLRVGVFSGTHIGTGCMVAARSVVESKFPNNCQIAGDPAKIIRKNIAWDRRLSGDDITQIKQEYRNFTIE